MLWPLDHTSALTLVQYILLFFHHYFLFSGFCLYSYKPTNVKIFSWTIILNCFQIHIILKKVYTKALISTNLNSTQFNLEQIIKYQTLFNKSKFGQYSTSVRITPLAQCHVEMYHRLSYTRTVFYFFLKLPLANMDKYKNNQSK